MSDINTLSLFDAALEYARRGWPSFPVRLTPYVTEKGESKVEKLPAIRHGFNAASTDPQQIAEWAATFPGCGIGVPTIDFCAADVDGPIGRDRLAAALGSHGALEALIASTTVVETGRDDGLHIYMQPGLPTKADILGPGSKVDSRGPGGYVVVPPTLYPNGRRYRFVNEVWPLAPVPEALLDAVATATRSKAPSADLNAELFAGTLPPPREPQYTFEFSDVIGRLYVMGLIDHKIDDAQYKAYCPAHKDSRPTLSVGIHEDGHSAAVYCFVGCTQDAIKRALGMWIELPSLNGDGSHDGAPLLDAPSDEIDWRWLFSEDAPDDEWLEEPVLLVGRSHLMYAAMGQGKSLIGLHLAVQVARRGVEVLVVDFEMAQFDVRQRILDMGYGEDDVALIHDVSLPLITGMDTDVGGEYIAKKYARYPNLGLVVFDSFNRGTEGDENESNVINRFYQRAIEPLTKRRIASLILDHEGHEGGRPRGSSNKGQQPDHIWALSAEVIRRGEEWRFTLRNGKPRIAAFPASVVFNAVNDDQGFLRIEHAMPERDQRTIDMIARLNEAGVPVDASINQATAILKTKYNVAGNRQVINKALNARRGGDDEP